MNKTLLHRPVPKGKVIDWVRRNYDELGGRQVVAGANVRCDYGPGVVIVHANAVTSNPSSFEFLGFFSRGTGATMHWHLKLRGGYVKYLGRAAVKIEDTIDGSAPAYADTTHPEISGGTADEPIRVCLQFSTVDNTVNVVSQAIEPIDSGTYWFKVLHEAYLDAAGSPVYVRSRLTDWTLGSPIS